MNFEQSMGDGGLSSVPYCFEGRKPYSITSVNRVRVELPHESSGCLSLVEVIPRGPGSRYRSKWVGTLLELTTLNGAGCLYWAFKSLEGLRRWNNTREGWVR